MAKVNVKDLVERGLEITRQIQALKTEQTEIESQLLKTVAGMKERAPTDPVTLHAVPGSGEGVQFTWSTKYLVHVESALKLKAKLGAEYSKVFSEKLSINRARSYGNWMVQAHAPKLDQLKKEIAEAVEETVSAKPSIKWKVAGASDVDDEDLR